MKTIKNYTDYGFGFPVVIDRVEVGFLGEEEVPLLNLNDLEDRVIRAMPDRAARLSGNEVRFIRSHFGLTLTAFGKFLGVSHAAVKQWEMKYAEPTGMEWAKEKNLRLYVLREIGCSDQEFVQLFDRLQDEPPAKAEPLSIVMQEWQPYFFRTQWSVQPEKIGASVREMRVNAMLHTPPSGQRQHSRAGYGPVQGTYGASRKTGATHDSFAYAA